MKPENTEEKIAEKIIEAVSAIINGTFKRKDLLDAISGEVSALRAEWKKKLGDRDYEWWQEICLVDNVAPNPKDVKHWLHILSNYEQETNLVKIAELESEITRLKLEKSPTVDGIPWYDFLSSVQKENEFLKMELNISRRERDEARLSDSIVRSEADRIIDELNEQIKSLKTENAELGQKLFNSEMNHSQNILHDVEIHHQALLEDNENLLKLVRDRENWYGEKVKADNEISRLTSTLARAHDALDGVVSVADRETVEFQKARQVLADKDGQLALERWKKMKEVIELARETCFHSQDCYVNILSEVVSQKHCSCGKFEFVQKLKELDKLNV